MARPLSEDKRNAIVDAAIEVIATLGISAPTAQIARRAGVAEGTLFTYFPNKNALLNAVYMHLKTELGNTIAPGASAGKTAAERCRWIWRRYIKWGAAHPIRYKAMKQLAVSELITDKSRKFGRECMGRMCNVFDEIAPRSAKRSVYTMAVMGALADMTLDFIAREPARIRHYTDAGFQTFWRATGQA